MIRVIVFTVIGLVLGLGGGTGVAVMKATKAAPTANAAKQDSSSTQ